MRDKIDTTGTWQERANRVLAQGCLTYSKRDTSYIRGVYASHCYGKASDTELHMSDGRIRIDHTCGLGSNVIRCDNNYGVPTIHEVRIAEQVLRLIPFADKLRFVKTGSAACSAAVRIARAKKKGLGVGTGYHGCDNWTIAAEKPGAGCESEYYLKAHTVQQLLDGISVHTSYCIVEPLALDSGHKHIAQLRELRAACTEHKVCLIFDEIITGFRVPQYFVSNWWGIEPDIICGGKALGGGHPLAFVAGKAEYMDTPDWFISNTHNGEVASLNAAQEVLDTLTPEVLDLLWAKGKWFMEAFNEISPKIQLKGYATRAIWEGEPEYIALFCEQMYTKGYLLHPGAWWIMVSHTTEMLEKELEAMQGVITDIDTKNIQLTGLMPEPVFRRNP